MQYFISKDRNIEVVVTDNVTKDFRLHNHTSHYIVSVVSKGSALLFYNNVNLRVMAGDVFIVRPYMPHSVTVDCDSQLLSLCVRKELFAENDTDMVCKLVDSKLVEVFERYSLSVAIKEKLTDAVSLISQTISDEHYVLPADIQRIADTIVSHSTDEFSLDELSSEVYVSKYHLIRKFKASVGLTPHQFLIQVRVRNAQKAINEGNRLIDAAVDNGFYDSSHFNKCFERIVGTTPSDYEKSNRDF